MLECSVAGRSTQDDFNGKLKAKITKKKKKKKTRKKEGALCIKALKYQN